MALSAHQITEKRRDRAKLIGEANALLADTNGFSAEVDAKHSALCDRIDALGAEIESNERELDADAAAADVNRLYRSAKERQSSLAAQLGAEAPASKAAAAAVRKLALAASPDDTDAQDDATRYRSAFGTYLRLGIAGMSGGERELLANSAEAIDMQKLAKADPELFAVISSGNDASAGYLIPADTMQAIEMAQLAYSGMLEAPTTKFTTANGREIPYPVTDDTGNAGAWIEESGDHSSATDPTYQVRKLGAHILSSKIVRVPIQFLTDAAINFEAHLNELFGERLGRAKNTAFTTGNGVGRPTGIVTGAYLGVTGGSSTAVTFDELTDLEHSLNRAHRVTGRTGYMAADSTIKAIKKLKDGEGRPIWQSGVALRQPDTINGWQFWVNDDIAALGSSAKSILFGDFSAYKIRTVAGRSILRLAERYAEYHQVGFVMLERVDGKLITANPTTLNPVKYFQNA